MLSNAIHTSHERRVTIGICVRNCEKYLKEAIDSIMSQDYPHRLLEIIIVEGKSEDKTSIVIRESIKNIDISTKLFSDLGKGLGSARNIVIVNAASDYILWVDGDMVLGNNFITKIVCFMEQHPEVGIAKGKQALEPGENLVSTLEGYSRSMSRMLDYRSEKGHLRSLGTSGSIYRNEIFHKVSGFDEKMRGYGEDQDLEMRVRAEGWLLDTVEAKYLDYERYKVTWNDLWSRYYLRGYYTFSFLRKNKGVIKHYRMFPLAAFLLGILQSRKLYRLTNRREVFLLPIHSFYKIIAWYVGYLDHRFFNVA
jgi:glycosyltransferase involved in cell wall biosynthesis